MKITKKFLRDIVLPYLKKYPKQYQIIAYARMNGNPVWDEEKLPKLDPAKPPPRGLRYDVEHLMVMLHPKNPTWNYAYEVTSKLNMPSWRNHATTVRLLEEYVK